MSSDSSLSRSVIDNRGIVSSAKRPSHSHPPRLQHSPSLPNIWFPPHSGPIPAEMIKNMKKGLNTSMEPRSPKRSPSTIASAIEPRAYHVKYASIDPIPGREKAMKTHSRRRTERDQPHSLLLTPPLTPSSSIRTTTSQTSGGIDGQYSIAANEIEVGEEITDSDPQSTRILMVGNVNRQASGQKFKASILEVLSTVNTKSDDVTRPSIDLPENSNIIKFFNEHHLQSKGIVYFLFRDVRIARKAHAAILNQATSRLKPFAGDDPNNDNITWFSCEFLRLDDLVPIIGYSMALQGVEDVFSIQVQKVEYSGGHERQESSSLDPVSQTSKSEPNHLTRRDDTINVSIIKNLLLSFGDLRFFAFGRQISDTEGADSVIYDFEYSDMKDGDAASNDLQDRVLCGMKFKISRTQGRVTVPGMTGLSKSNSFNDSHGPLIIGTAGSLSEVRTRFNYAPNENISIKTLTVPAGDNGTLSPTYFYSSPSVDVEVSNLKNQYTNGTNLANTNPPLRDISSYNEDITYRSDVVSPCYSPEGSCLYCPSKSLVAGVSVVYPPGIPQYGLPVPTPQPAPGYYSPMPMGHHRMNFNAMQFHHPWGYDPAIAAIGGGLNNPMAPLPANLNTFYSPAYANTPDRHPQFVPQHMVQAVAPPPQGSPQPFAHISTPDSSPSSINSTSLIRYEGTTTAVTTPNQSTNTNGSLVLSVQTDRNQLNIQRIESGIDTRTTVMIKNIPNKMSDVDLQTYIENVRPRRIDFMYLRMDFKNGCNVGYAFVNFITVQDLLYFAKQKLGVKWNMFSSEKMLQMSYANYQGKEALIEKFKNSAIMDERESWRPRIFYSSGVNQGLPEPFPPPTHIRRKERSSYNRGTLFPPGSNILNNTPPRRYNEDYRGSQTRGGGGTSKKINGSGKHL